MEEAVVQAQVRPENILKELHELWVSLGEQTGGSESPGVLRACAMTLVVATSQAEDALAVREVLAELIREHPSRVIVLCLRHGAEPLLEARVTAECWLPFGGRQQICCERIEISAGEANLPDLPPLLLALAAPGLPVVLWCRHAPLVEVAEFQPIAGVADKLILDSSTCPEAGSILRHMAALPAVADLSWTRLTGWREIIARLFDDAGRRERLAGLAELRISYAGEAIPVGGYYLAAWVLSVLGEIGVHFDAISEPPRSGSGVLGLMLAAPGWSVSVRQVDDATVETAVDSVRQRSALPQRTEVSVLWEELAIAGRDHVYDRVLRLAAQMAGRQGR